MDTLRTKIFSHGEVYLGKKYIKLGLVQVS